MSENADIVPFEQFKNVKKMLNFDFFIIISFFIHIFVPFKKKY